MKNYCLLIFLLLSINLFTLASEYERVIYKLDIDNDGYKEQIIERYSGGAHCCFEREIYDSYGSLNLFMNNAEYFEIKDIDKDGLKEIITAEDFSYVFDLCSACSPFIEIVANYKDNQLILKKDFMKKNLPKYHLKPVSVWLEKKRFKHSDMYKFSEIIGAIIMYIYVGEPKLAKETMQKYLKFKNEETKKAFLKDLHYYFKIKYFWPQIKDSYNQFIKMLRG